MHYLPDRSQRRRQHARHPFSSPPMPRRPQPAIATQTINGVSKQLKFIAVANSNCKKKTSAGAS